VLPAGVIDRKGEFAANCDETARDVRPGHGTQVPRIKQEKDCFIGNSYRVSLVAHNLEPFCELSIDAFNEHWIVIRTR
jgi:hypothetical protein